MTDESCPPDRCYGCWDRTPRHGGRDPELMDLRTGRRFCHECMAALVTWELDGCPEPDELPYADWLELPVVSTVEELNAAIAVAVDRVNRNESPDATC